MPPDGTLSVTLGNDELGDGYRYRPRGYLYLNGKNAYKNYSTPPGPTKNSNALKNPDIVSVNIVAAFKTAAAVWTTSTVKGDTKPSNDWAKGDSSVFGKGNFSDFQRTVEVSQQYGKNIQTSALAFEKVLETFDMISYDRP